LTNRNCELDSAQQSTALRDPRHSSNIYYGASIPPYARWHHPGIRGLYFYHADIIRAIALGSRPTMSLEDGMKSYIGWLATHDEAALD
jgi:nucleoside-diphosphate-sugar epimerase